MFFSWVPDIWTGHCFVRLLYKPLFKIIIRSALHFSKPIWGMCIGCWILFSLFFVPLTLFVRNWHCGTYTSDSKRKLTPESWIQLLFQLYGQRISGVSTGEVQPTGLAYFLISTDPIQHKSHWMGLMLGLWIQQPGPSTKWDCPNEGGVICTRCFPPSLGLLPVLAGVVSSTGWCILTGSLTTQVKPSD